MFVAIEGRQRAHDEGHRLGEAEVAAEVFDDLPQKRFVVRCAARGVAFALVPEYGDDLAVLLRGAGAGHGIVVGMVRGVVRVDAARKPRRDWRAADGGGNQSDLVVRRKGAEQAAEGAARADADDAVAGLRGNGVPWVGREAFCPVGREGADEGAVLVDWFDGLAPCEVAGEVADAGNGDEILGSRVAAARHVGLSD